MLSVTLGKAPLPGSDSQAGCLSTGAPTCHPFSAGLGTGFSVARGTLKRKISSEKERNNEKKKKKKKIPQGLEIDKAKRIRIAVIYHARFCFGRTLMEHSDFINGII
jgi:hypothetical protein